MTMEGESHTYVLKWGCAWGNTYFTCKYVLYKCDIVASGQKKMEVMTIIDLLLLKRDMAKYVNDMKSMRGT